MKKLTEKEYVAPWEKTFSKVLTPLEEFIHRQTTSGILLMLRLYQRYALKTFRASKEIQQGQSQKVDPSKPIAGSKENIPKAEEKETPAE